MTALTAMGHAVGVIKPIETGVQEAPLDGTLLLETLHTLNPKARHLDIDDVVPVQMRLPAAPYIASNRGTIDRERIDAALERMEEVCDVCLIEGAGGLLVPVDAEKDMIDLIADFRAKALLVTHCRLGCINDTRLSLEALAGRGIPHEWVLNCRETDRESFAEISQPYFDDRYPGWHLLEGDLEQLCTALLL